MVSDQPLIFHKVFILLLPFKGEIIPFTGVTKCKHPQNSEKKKLKLKLKNHNDNKLLKKVIKKFKKRLNQESSYDVSLLISTNTF